MESKKINQLATAVNPSTSDLAIIGDPVTGVSKKITWLQVSTLIGTAANLQQVTDNGATTTNPVTIGGLTITGLSTGVLKSDSGVISSVPFGAANGVATLAGDGKVPSSQLPSYVDDVVEVANYAALPVTGETGKIYITLDNNKVYRWGGSVYVEIAANNAIWGSITGTLANQTDLQNALDAKANDSAVVHLAGTETITGTKTFSNPSKNDGGILLKNGASYSLSGYMNLGGMTDGLRFTSGGGVSNFFTLPSSVGYTYTFPALSGTIVAISGGNSTQYIDGTGALQTFPTLLSSDNLVKLVRNQSGATMTAGTIVYISGATGNKPLITKAIATSDATSAQTFGLVQANIANNADGYVVIIGNIGDLDTSALTEGQQLYLSGTTAGAWTTTKPYAPTHLVYVGIVLRSHPNQGIIGVKIQNGYEMDELHNVDAQSPSNNDILSYNTSTSLWEHKQIATTLGFTPISLASLSATSPLIYNNGTGAFSIQVATASQNGYLSSTDWSTFNNKQAALGGTGFVKISGSTISYDNSTYYLASNPSGYITLASLSAGAGISYSNITGVISSTITQYTDALARAAFSESVIGLDYNSTTGVLSTTTGYAIPTTAKQAEWDTAYTNRITSLTTTGSNGSASLVSNTLNVPTYTLSGLGGQPLDADLTAIAALAGTSGFLKKTAADTWALDTNTYLTGNQTITLSGDVSGSGATAITTTIGALKVTNAMLAGSIDLTTKVTGLLPDGNISSAATWNAKQAAITLTTTGTSGVATFISNTLNIPNYTYTLPTASTSVLGGVKVDGTTITINGSGVISGANTYSLPIATSSVLGGVKIGSGVSVDVNGVISVSTNYQAPLNGTGFVKATGTTISYDNSTYLTTTSAASTYLPLVGGTLTGDLTITRAAITASSVNANNSDGYSYFSNQEGGTLKTYFLYLNSAFVDVDRRETLEIRNQVGKMTFYTAATLALTIDTNQYSTFAKNVNISNGLLNVYNGGSGESFIVNAGTTGNAIGVRTRTGNDYAFFNWRSINGSELLAESYIQRTAANTGVLRHTINNGTSPAIYQTISSTGTITFNSLSGTGTRMVVADANGLLSTQAITSNVTGSGTNNKVAKFTSTGSTIGDSIITATANDVTISSTLVGPMFILAQTTAAAYSQMQFLGDTKHAYIFKGNSTYTSYGGANALNFYTDSVGGGGFAFHPAAITNAVFIDNNGNLGIGVGTSVGAKLDISGGNAIIANNNNGASTWQIRNSNAGTGAYTSLQLGNDTNNNKGGIAMLGSGFTTTGVYYANGIYLYTSGTGGVTISAESSTGVINFATNLNLKARFNKDGYLGINEATPTNLLHLADDSATPSLRLASTSTGYYWDIGRENATTGDFLFNYTNNGTFAGTFARITTAGLFGIGVTPSGTYGKLTVAGGIRTTADSGSKLEIGRYNAGNPDSYIKLGTTSNRLIISKNDDSADLFYFSNTAKLGIGIDPTFPLHVSAASGYMANFTNGTNSLKVYCGSTYSILEGNSGNQMGWLGSGFYIEAGTTPVNRFSISAAGLTTITGELTLTGSSTHMNIISDTLYAYTRYQGGTNDMYLIQNLPTLTNNGVSAGAAYFYMSNSQQFEFNWAGNSKIQFTSTGQATFAADVIAFSDISVKENIRTIDNALGRIIKSRGVLYDRIDTKVKDNIGFIAQELELEFPELISINADGTKGVKYQNAVAVLFEAVKEQQKQIDDLKKQMA